MKKALLIIGIAVVLLLAIFITVAYISYRNLKIEGDDFERPENCWMAETLIVNSDYEVFYAPRDFSTFCCFKSREQYFGNSGKSGILSEYTVERLAEMEAESENNGTYDIYCVFYGTCHPEELQNVYSLINVLLVTDEGVYYLDNEEAFDISNSRSWVSCSNLKYYSYWAQNAPDGRITFEYNPYEDVPQEEMTAVYGVFSLEGVKVKKQGTLYATVKVDIDAERETRVVYPSVSMEVGEGTATKAEPIVSVENFSVGYLTASDYNDGNYSDEAIRSDAVFENGGHCYMVVDFSISALVDNDGTYALHALTHIGDRKVLDISVEEAPTTKLETVMQNDDTAIYATFTVPPNAGETKTVRIIVRLLPVGEGAVSTSVFLLGQDGVELNDVAVYFDKFEFDTSTP